MTWALCFNCGEIKFGALCPCSECRAEATGNSDLDIAFSDHRLAKSTLEDFGSIIQQIRQVRDDDELRFWTFLHYVSENYPTILSIDSKPEMSATVHKVLERVDLPRITLEQVPRRTAYPERENDAEGKRGIKKMRRTHRFTPMWWLGLLSMGSLYGVIVIGTLVKSYPDVLAGRMGLVDYLGLLFVILGMFPWSILTLMTPFVSKIVVSSQGLEYHTLAYVLESDWQSLVLVGDVERGFAGTATVLSSQEPRVLVRKWAKRVPWDVGRKHSRRTLVLGPSFPREKFQVFPVKIHNPAGRAIPISWFGGFGGRALKADIRKLAPHLGV